MAEYVQVLTQVVETQHLLSPVPQPPQLLTELRQGPPGPPGDPSGALLTARRLSEFADDRAAQADAQQNLGLGLIDPLAYYILAKN